MAVLDNRPNEAKRLAGYEALMTERNSEGLTPLQLARFLGRKKCEAALSVKEERKILIQTKSARSPKPFTPDEFRALFSIPYYEAIRFRDYVTLRLAAKSVPYILRLPGLENRTLGEKYAQTIDQGAIASVSVRYIDETFGYGLFAEEDLKTDAWIGEYTGIVREYLRTKPDQNAYCLHYPTRFWSFRYMMIDALPGGNETRFINHSDEPNLQPQCLVLGRFLHTIFFTNRPVKRGEPLTFDYGPDFWRKRKKALSDNLS